MVAVIIVVIGLIWVHIMLTRSETRTPDHDLTGAGEDPTGRDAARTTLARRVAQR